MDAFLRLAPPAPARAGPGGRSRQQGRAPAPLAQHPSPVPPKSNLAAGGKINIPQRRQAGKLRRLARPSPATPGTTSIPPPLRRPWTHLDFVGAQSLCPPGRGRNQSQPALPRQRPARGCRSPAPGRAPEEHPGAASACGDITMPLSCRGMFPLFRSVATSPHCHDFSNSTGSTEPLPPQVAEDQRKHLLGCALSPVPRPQGNAPAFSSSAPRRVQLVLAGLLDPTVQRDGSLLSPGPGDAPAAKDVQTGLPRMACARGPWISTSG